MKLRAMANTIELDDGLFGSFALGPEHGSALQALLEASADYCELAMGRRPGPGDANAVYYAGPEEGREPGDKMLLGLRRKDSGEFIGVLDAFRDYPERSVWYIGLLLFAPTERGKGIGRHVVEALASAARSAGARELQLNVLEHNQAAHRCWSSCGFSEIRRWRGRLGERESTFIRMRRAL